MKKRLSAGLATGLFMFGVVGVAQATLTTIGTATFNPDGMYYGSDKPGVHCISDTTGEFKLIWDDDNNGQSLIWLDFTSIISSAHDEWYIQDKWTKSLSIDLTINIYSNLSVDWGNNDWRLSTAIIEPDVNVFEKYNIISSELEHLFNSELGNVAGQGFENVGPFANLISTKYYTDTLHPIYNSSVASFSTVNGENVWGWADSGVAIAVRTGMVSVSPTPEPATMLLFGTGLVGLVGTRLRRKKKA